MSKHLRAVVVGAGWAGEAHTKALQWCGAEVAAIFARRPEAVRAVADRLGVIEASTDWRATIERLRPDIVALDGRVRRCSVARSQRPERWH